VRHLGQNNSTWVHTEDNTHYAFYSGRGLVLVDTARRVEARLGPVLATILLPGNRAAARG
jgi:mannose-6-phosphate isomerase-like protein (cupin superfamily)